MILCTTNNGLDGKNLHPGRKERRRSKDGTEGDVIIEKTENDVLKIIIKIKMAII